MTVPDRVRGPWPWRLVRVTLDVFRDDRGAFMETWQSRKFADSGIAGPFVQDNSGHLGAN